MAGRFTLSWHPALCTPRSTCHTHPMTDDERAALLALREQGAREGLAWVVEAADLALWEG